MSRPTAILSTRRRTAYIAPHRTQNSHLQYCFPPKLSYCYMIVTTHRHTFHAKAYRLHCAASDPAFPSSVLFSAQVVLLLHDTRISAFSPWGVVWNHLFLYVFSFLINIQFWVLLEFIRFSLWLRGEYQRASNKNVTSTARCVFLSRWFLRPNFVLQDGLFMSWYSFVVLKSIGPCYDCGRQMPVSRRGGPCSVLGGFVWYRRVDDVVMVKRILLVSSVFPPLNSILPLLHTYLSPLPDGIFMAVQKFVTFSVFNFKIRLQFWPGTCLVTEEGDEKAFFSLIWVQSRKSVHSPNIFIFSMALQPLWALAAISVSWSTIYGR
jgi:hypothetical protein